MKVLLDENVPETLTPAFDRFETWHINELGWQGKENGPLLRAARAAGFTALVTTDVNLYNQQKARLHGLALIVLRVFSNAPSGIIPLVPAAQDLLAVIVPGEIKYLYIDPRLRESDRRRRRGEFAD
jgi:predicted nuclease of predicted toxin-antitoxin system